MLKIIFVLVALVAMLGTVSGAANKLTLGDYVISITTPDNTKPVYAPANVTRQLSGVTTYEYKAIFENKTANKTLNVDINYLNDRISTEPGLSQSVCEAQTKVSKSDPVFNDPNGGVYHYLDGIARSIDGSSEAYVQSYEILNLKGMPSIPAFWAMYAYGYNPNDPSCLAMISLNSTGYTQDEFLAIVDSIKTDGSLKSSGYKPVLKVGHSSGVVADDSGNMPLDYQDAVVNTHYTIRVTKG